MDQRKIPWKSEWKAAGLDPGPLTDAEQAFVPQLEAENRAFLEKHPPRVVLRRRPIALVSPWTLSAAAAAVLLLVALPLAPPSDTAALERMKGSGDPVLAVYRQADGKAERLNTRSTVRPGDVLQAAYQVSKPVQGALLSVDGSGNVTIHLAKQGRSVALVPGGERPLEFSYELDRAPQFETFFLFTSDAPFELEPLRQRLKLAASRTLAPDAFGSGIRFAALALTKEAGR